MFKKLKVTLLWRLLANFPRLDFSCEQLHPTEKTGSIPDVRVAKVLVLLLTLCMMSSGDTIAKDEKGTPGRVMRLSLRDCIDMALKNNLDVSVARLKPAIAAEDISFAESEFEPLFSAKTGASRQKGSTGLFWTSDDESFSIGTSLKKKFLSGTGVSLWYEGLRHVSEYELTGLLTGTRSDKKFGSEVALSVTQPILRNGWIEFNESKIMLAKKNKEIADLNFIMTIIDVIVKTETAYWKLVHAIKEREVQRKSLELAREILAIQDAKVKAGVLSPIEKLEAEVRVATQEEQILIADNNVLDAQDRVLVMIQPPGKAHEWEVEIQPSDFPPVVYHQIDLEQSIERAKRTRPEVLAAIARIEAKEIELKRAENQLLPLLDFKGMWAYTGRDDIFKESLQELDDREYYRYELGLTLEIPLGNEAAQSSYRKARLEKEKLEHELRGVEQNVVIEVREAVREIETTLMRMKAATKARELAERHFEEEKKKLEVGLSTAHQVLDVEEDYLRASANELKATIDYNLAVLQYRRAIGTVLEEQGLEVR